MNTLNMAPSLTSRPGRGLNLPKTKVVSEQSNDNEKGDRLIKSTFDLLEKGEKEIRLDDKYKDVVFILGNTGSGKSTFTHWLAGDNTELISTETQKGEYIIEDHKRTSNAILETNSFFPELVIDAKTITAYYDCPGFSDDQETSHEIASTYFMKKLTDYSESIKMIFLISHPYVRKGVDRKEFMKLLRHTTNFVKDVENFKHSIALVATEVDNQSVKQGQAYTKVEDEKMIAEIADFLQEVKQYLEDSSKSPNVSEKEQTFFKKATLFIDILLEKDSEHYPKIGLFRRPDVPGPVSDIPLLQNSKRYIENILYENLNFTKKHNEDFDYTVSEKTKNDINHIAEEINKNLWSSLSTIAGKIQEYYRTLVEQIRSKIRFLNSQANSVNVDNSEVKVLWQKFSNGLSITSDLVTKMKNVTNPEKIAVIFNNTPSNLAIDIPNDDVLFIENQGKFYNFLQVVSGKLFSSKPWDHLFKDVETFISNSKIIILHDVDSTINTLNNRLQTILNDTIVTMQSECTEKIKLVEIQKKTEMLNQNSRITSEIIEEIKNGTTEKLMNAVRHISNLQGDCSTKENLEKMSNLAENLDSLEFFHNEALVSRSIMDLHPLQSLANYFHESGQWYNFLKDLYATFSEYEIQKEREKYNVADLEDWGQPGKTQGIVVTTNTFEQFLNKIKNFNMTEYENIKNMSSTTDLQIEELNEVLSLTLKHKPVIRCSETLISVKGNYVSLNETMQSVMDNLDTDNSCKNFKAEYEAGKYTLFKAFALNKIFIDTDLSFSGKGISVVLIAPKWEVVGTRNINITGADGDPQSVSKAKNGVNPGNAGTNGVPGKPGRGGESFFGIGSDFVNGNNLKITSNGGKGGPGQDGGNGAPLVPGKDAYTPSGNDPGCEKGYINNHKCKKLNEFNCDTKYWYCIGETIRMFGDPCIVSNGGDGGQGGKGGDMGNVTLLELSQPSNISKIFGKGNGGELGKGGDSSQQGKNGDDKIANRLYWGPGGFDAMFGADAYHEWKSYVQIRSNGNCIGEMGKNGANEANILPPIPANGIGRIPSIINEYKIYLRENLNNCFNKPFLLSFLDQLNNTNDVRQLYNIIGLINEFQGLEDQFHKLSNQMDFAPLYSSLLDRITDAAKNHKNDLSAENKKGFNYLYTAILGRIYNLKQNSESYLVLDILGYLNLVKDNVKTLRDLQNMNNKVNVINKYKENFKKDIDHKIQEAKSFINKQILLIDNISGKIDDNLNTLIAETIALEKEAEKQKEILEDKKAELEKALKVKGVFNLFRTIGGIVSFLGPIGEITGTVIEITSTVGEDLALNGHQDPLNLPSDVLANLKHLGDQIKVFRNQKIANLNKLLDIVSEEIRRNPEKLSDMSRKIADIKDKLKKATDNKFDFKQVKELEGELNQELKRKGDDLKIHSSDKKSVDALKVVGKLTQIAQFGSLLLNIHDKMKPGEEELKTVTDALDQIKDEFVNLKEYEESIYSTMAPMLQKMEADMKDIVDKLGGKSQVALEVTKWQVQSTLKDLKLIIQRLTTGFKVKDDLSRNIENIYESMTTLINIYDRIQSFQLQQNQANYIADISSVAANSIDIKDEQLGNAINKLEMVIRANIVLNQYKSALSAFKQWVFPFVDLYIQKPMLPSELETDMELPNLVQNAMREIEAINEELVLYKVALSKNDQYLENEYFNSQHLSTQPFFVWKNEEHGNIIANLLSGKEVVLKSDIKESAPYKDAIKFSEIEFYFKIKNETAQSLLLETLKGFDIRATHIGNSYYRYENKTSVITSDSVTISYSYEKNNDGLPLRFNKGYYQLKEGNFLLSPYTVWEVRLINRTNIYSFKDLERYINETDIELSGFGHYVDTNLLGVTAYKTITGHNDTIVPDFKYSAKYVKECRRSKYRLTRSPKEMFENIEAMTNDAPTGMSSPINYLCNFLKTFFLTNAITSINKVFFREHESIKNHNDCYKLPNESACSAMASKFTATVTVKEVISGKDEYTESNAHSVLIPDLNCSLLLADLVTRTVTGTKYKAATDECLLSPREVILRKISNGMMQSENDIKQNLQRLLSEKEDVSSSSWFRKISNCARSTFQFFGLAGNENTEEYVQSIGNLYS